MTGTIEQRSPLPSDLTALQAIILGLHEKLVHRDAEVAQHASVIAQHASVIAQRDTRIAELELEKLRLEHQLELYKKRYYGPRADKAEDVAQLLLDFGTELEQRPVEVELPGATPAETAAQPRRVRRGRRNLALFNALPVMRKVHDLSEQQKRELAGDGKLVEIAPEVTWQVEYMPGHFCRVEHIQKKYVVVATGQEESEKSVIAQAQKPQEGLEKCMAGPGLLAYVVVSKYADYLPLYRLEGIFERNGLEIDRSTMCLWCADVAQMIQPLHRLMIQRVLSGHVVGTDDTVMPLLAPEKTKQARMWIYRGDDQNPYNVFDFTISRGRDGPDAFLGDYQGVLLADAYGGYEGICTQKQITKAGCWAHARRKFVDCQKLSPEICAEALELIGKLFATERLAKEKQLSVAARLALRQAESLPVTQVLERKLQEWKLRLVPKHPVAQAIGYALNQWESLTVFLKEGAVAIDNNLAEQEMKRIALLRKNALFVGTERGGQTAAVLSSLTSTCRRLGVNPQHYLTQLLVNLPGTPMSQVEQWLPDVWQRRMEAEVAAEQPVA